MKIWELWKFGNGNFQGPDTESLDDSNDHETPSNGRKTDLTVVEDEDDRAAAKTIMAEVGTDQKEFQVRRFL